MGILDEIQKKDSWLSFMEYRKDHDRLSKEEEQYLMLLLASDDFFRYLEHMKASDFVFEPPEKKAISKLGTSRKRIVYTYGERDTWILKVLTYLLYRYDGTMSPNCYSFRKERGVKSALARLRAVTWIDAAYSYKTDIHDYFNSINIEVLLPEMNRLLSDDPDLYQFLARMLLDGRAIQDGRVIYEKRGAMAGTPISPFLANLYLKDLDILFYDRHIPYARYSDDMIVFAQRQEEIKQYAGMIRDVLQRKQLTINSQKESWTEPGQAWSFLGIKYQDGKTDLSFASKEKVIRKLRRKRRALSRWKRRQSVPDEIVVKTMIQYFNRKMYDNPVHSELTWTRWFFPLITESGTLREIDHYMQEGLRYLVTGRHTKTNYRVSYDNLKQLGYRSLVHEYYSYLEGIDKTCSTK